MMAIIGSLPYTLINGQVADATQVMADFNTIVANVNAGAAANGANGDITSLSGLTTPLSTTEGGTGAASLNAAGIVNTSLSVAVVGQVPTYTATNGKQVGSPLTVGNAIGNIVGVVSGSAGAALPVLSGENLTNLPTANKLAQIVSTVTGAVASGTTQIPYDDTIPENTEGDQYMSLAITPQNALSTLEIVVTFVGAVANAGDQLIVALFQDANVGALAAAASTSSNNGFLTTTTFIFLMAAGTTSATTFKVRAGTGTGSQVTFNGAAGSRKLGGVIASSIVITEKLP